MTPEACVTLRRAAAFAQKAPLRFRFDRIELVAALAEAGFLDLDPATCGLDLWTLCRAAYRARPAT